MVDSLKAGLKVPVVTCLMARWAQLYMELLPSARDVGDDVICKVRVCGTMSDVFDVVLHWAHWHTTTVVCSFMNWAFLCRSVGTPVKKYGVNFVSIK